MKNLKTFSLLLLFSSAIASYESYAQVKGQVNATAAEYLETPVKTIFIKHPLANDVATYFATNTTYLFEIYKPGDMNAIMTAIKKNPGVESCTIGVVTGDYHAFTLVLKAEKDKMWFIRAFKDAGINTIKINNNPIVDVDKM